MARRDGPLYDEEKEKAAIEWENKVLFYLMPSVGLVAFIIGLVGFILAIQSPDAVGTPTFSVCPVHGYLQGEHFTCDKCKKEQEDMLKSKIAALEKEKAEILATASVK